MRKKSLLQEGKAISKTEDKTWHEWYDKLTPEDHNKILSKLGLDKEDIEEFKEDVFYDTQNKPAAKKPSKKKAKKKKK